MILEEEIINKESTIIEKDIIKLMMCQLKKNQNQERRKTRHVNCGRKNKRKERGPLTGLKILEIFLKYFSLI